VKGFGEKTRLASRKFWDGDVKGLAEKRNSAGAKKKRGKGEVLNKGCEERKRLEVAAKKMGKRARKGGTPWKLGRASERVFK